MKSEALFDSEGNQWLECAYCGGFGVFGEPFKPCGMCDGCGGHWVKWIAPDNSSGGI